MTQILRRGALRSTLALAALLAPLATTDSILAQETKRAVTHDDYDQWTSLRSTTYSDDGKWMAFSVEPRVGDGTLYIQQVDGDKRYEVPRGTSLKFSNDNTLAFYKIDKSSVEERRKKLKKLHAKKEEGEEKAGEGAEEELPPDVKAALKERGMPERAARRMMEQRGASMSEVRSFLGLPEPEEEQAKEEPKKKSETTEKSAEKEAEEKAAKAAKALAKRVHVLDLATGEVTTIENVKGYRLIEDSDLMVVHFEKPKEKEEEKEDDQKKAPAGEEKSAETEGAAGEAQQKAETPKKQKPKAAPPKKAKESEEKTEEPAAERMRGRRGRRSGQGRGGRAGRGGRGQGERRGGRPGGRSKDREDDEPASKGKRSDGTKLMIRDLASGVDVELEHVRSYGTLADDKWLYYVVGTKKEEDGVEQGLFARELSTGTTTAVLPGYSNVSGMTTDEADAQVAFSSDLRTFGEEEAERDIYLWTFGAEPARRILTKETAGVPEDHKLSSSGLSFSRDGAVLMFSVRQPKVEDLPKILSEDEVKLDLWHYRDGLLQTMQAKRSDPRKASLTAAFHMKEDRAVMLGTPRNPRVSMLTDDGGLALLSDSKPYEMMITWDGRYSDHYVVNTADGSRTKIVGELRGSVSKSTGGNYVVWFDHRDYDWHCYDVRQGTTRNLTSEIPVAFDREQDDRPEPHRAHGVTGWTEGDAEVLLNDEFDIWAVDPKSGAFRCVTDGLGRAKGLTLRNSRVDLRPDASRDDEEEERWLRNELVLTATNTETYATGYYTDTIDGDSEPKELVMKDARVSGVSRPEDADRLFMTFSRFDQFPDVWTSDLAFQGARKLTDGCPLRREVRWGAAELVRWRSDDGTELKGYLVKPDGFDPEKQYPMMVYFYEKSSNRIHSFVSPNVGTSPNAAYYVSNGYLWFVPDIVYRDGYPGESCEKCVVAGVQSLIAKGFVDKDAIGVAGHSWGGYQTAHLITRTDIFAAAESGAPVVNMFSAYGGIRWGSGMSRQFQYEQTQSRIGGTIWERPMQYWENSPLFHLDKANTPVLILHNDKDGAVPWYQGIEFFVAMRRLGKEAYLANYNGEDHGLRKRQNQRDWTRRMAQFFHHHLKGAPAPEWMTRGVPYHEREAEKIPHAPSYREAMEAGLIEEAGAESPQTETETEQAAGNRDQR